MDRERGRLGKLGRGMGRALAGAGRKAGYLARATGWAVLLGLVETLRSERGRRLLALCALVGGVAAIALAHPIATVAPGEVAVRTNRLTGSTRTLGEGWAVVLPGLHDLRRYSLRDRVYRPEGAAQATGAAPFQSVEGLSIGVDVAVRWALDPARIGDVTRGLPDDPGTALVEPVVDGVLHRRFAEHTVRDIFSGKRAEIQAGIEEELRGALAKDGVLVRGVTVGNVDLPREYRAGLESLLGEELATEKMRFTLELKAKEVDEARLEAEAEKVKREKAAEAAAVEEVTAAKAKAEAMQHVLPFKEKEIEQRRLEAEAAKVARVKQAEGEAEARRLEGAGEADARRKLAEAEAYRLEQTGAVQTKQMAAESRLIAQNPLLIQKTMADKLSDKIQVIIAPPSSGGFIAGNLLGRAPSTAGKASDRDAARGTEGTDDDHHDGPSDGE